MCRAETMCTFSLRKKFVKKCDIHTDGRTDRQSLLEDASRIKNLPDIIEIIILIGIMIVALILRLDPLVCTKFPLRPSMCPSRSWQYTQT